MTTSTSPDTRIEWGTPSRTVANKHWPLVLSGTLCLAALATDILTAVALAQESASLWLWASGLVGTVVGFIASLNADHFKVRHYVADASGIHLQYEIATGPLEAPQLVHKTQVWSGLRSATLSMRADGEESETPDGVVLVLGNPLESGRTRVPLPSDCPEQLLAMAQAPNSTVARAQKTARGAMAIA